MNKSTASHLIKSLESIKPHISQEHYQKDSSVIDGVKVILNELAEDDVKMDYASIQTMLLDSGIFTEEWLKKDQAIIPQIIDLHNNYKLSSSELRGMLEKMKIKDNIKNPSSYLIGMIRKSFIK